MTDAGLRDVSDIKEAIGKGEIRFAQDALILVVGCGACGGHTGVDASSLAAELAKATVDVNAMVIGTRGGSDQAKLASVVGKKAAESGQYEFAPNGWYAFIGTSGKATQLTAEQLGSTDDRVLRTSALLKKRPMIGGNK